MAISIISSLSQGLCLISQPQYIQYLWQNPAHLRGPVFHIRDLTLEKYHGKNK